GEYTSIQAAIDGLPEAGGRVCVLPGTYEESVRVTRDDVFLEGCGAQTRLRPDPEDPGAPLVQVLGSRVTIRDLTLLPEGQLGVLVGTEGAGQVPEVREVKLERLTVSGEQRAGLGGQTRSTILVR